VGHIARAILAASLFVAVMTLVVWRPRRLSIGWPAAVGAALAVAFGLVSVAAVGRVVDLVWNATLAFVGIILNSLVLDQIGLFAWAARQMARWSRGRGRLLFVYTVLLGAAVAALFANDGAALILTPLIYEQGRALGFSREESLALVMAGGFIADFGSTPLVVSNLVNILTADFFHLPFGRYALTLLPVDAVTVGATLLVLYLVYWRDIPDRVAVDALPDPREAVRDFRLFRWSWVVLGILLAGFLLSGPLNVPLSLVVGVATVLFFALGWRSPAVSVKQAVVEAPWAIVVFSVGLYVVVFGLRDAGLLHWVSAAIRGAEPAGRWVALLVTGGLSAGLSGVMNNLPAVVVVNLSIRNAAPAAMAAPLAYANVIGADLGPKLTPIGSLATLLWLHVLQRRGLTISWRYYMKVGLVLTLPILFVTLTALWAVTLLGL
jgi:arsenical pump membrane protein